jgi:hypothetical protein
MWSTSQTQKGNKDSTYGEKSLIQLKMQKMAYSELEEALMQD